MISAKRRKTTKKIIKRRIRQIKTFSTIIDDKILKQPNRLAKNHAFGCRRSDCYICRQRKVKR
jgi:hypothetical protein